ncbi:MAG: hypothetical protein Q9170_008114 [Blastenia crenularia]
MEKSIGEDINSATRSYHTALNQSILHFLPLGLPPHTSSHHLYAFGISYFYPIYFIFESTFRDHLSSNALPPRIASILRQLHLPELERAQALERDIKLLLPSPYRVPDSTALPRLETFRQHAQSSLNQKPHLLFAYTWIFYMALFSGGRYIRSKLRNGLASSIVSLPSAQLDASSGLSFWEFDGEYDGEDLKIDYKSRVAALSSQLTDEEGADIVAEGVQIMAFLMNLVKEIAEAVPARAATLVLEAPLDNDQVGTQGPVTRTRLPWFLILRILSPFGLLNIMSSSLGAITFRPPDYGAATTLPVQL